LLAGENDEARQGLENIMVQNSNLKRICDSLLKEMENKKTIQLPALPK
jgi:hypothetical protein